MRPYLITYVGSPYRLRNNHIADDQFSNILLADLLLTGMIAYGLWKAKTGWKDTDAMIKRIIM